MRIRGFFILIAVSSFIIACQQQTPETPSTSREDVKMAVEATPEVVSTEPAVVGKAKELVKRDAMKVSERKSEEVAAAVKSVESTVLESEESVTEKRALSTAPVVEVSKEIVVTEVVKAAVVSVVEVVAGNPVQGAKVAKKCSACHTFDQGGKNKTGPNLAGIVGRTKGGDAKFRYAGYLKAENAAGAVWDEAGLRDWILDSKAVARAGGSKSKMSAQKIQGVKADDLIAYLKTL